MIFLHDVFFNVMYVVPTYLVNNSSSSFMLGEATPQHERLTKYEPMFDYSYV
jgi:hypothetical protein